LPPDEDQVAKTSFTVTDELLKSASFEDFIKNLEIDKVIKVIYPG
jgi:hypothetical protein